MIKIGKMKRFPMVEKLPWVRRALKPINFAAWETLIDFLETSLCIWCFLTLVLSSFWLFLSNLINLYNKVFPASRWVISE